MIDKAGNIDYKHKVYTHSLIRKYTSALLDAFSSIYLPRFDEDGNFIKEILVPIQFGNKDKAYYLKQHSTNNLVTGNTASLPRMALALTGIQKAAQRDTSKYVEVIRQYQGNKARFSFNSVSYDIGYTLYIATKTLTDASNIIESIAPLFRPTYTIPVYELDIQEEPTNVIVELSDVSIELPTPDSLTEEELRIIRIEMPLVVRGNLYLPIKEQETIQKIQNILLDPYTKENLVTIKTDLDKEKNIRSYFEEPEDNV